MRIRDADDADGFFVGRGMEGPAAQGEEEVAVEEGGEELEGGGEQPVEEGGRCPGGGAEEVEVGEEGFEGGEHDAWFGGGCGWGC